MMIPIRIQNGSPLIWDASDWLKLREEHRIVGNLVGCLVGLPRQDTLQGLPLNLLPEEVTLLIEKKVAFVTNDSILSKPPDEKMKEKFLSYRDQTKKDQAIVYEDQRKQQVSSMIDRIIEGKRRKLLGLSSKKKKSNSGDNSNEEEAVSTDLEIDREEILKNELNKVVPTPSLLVQTFTKEQWIEEPNFEPAQWNYPATECEKLKYSTFKDLWEKGYYITEGHKFGVDYLVYPGDPVKFHAQFLVVCKPQAESMSTVDFISYARLGSISRKTFVIASQSSSNEEVLYQSIQWAEKS